MKSTHPTGPSIGRCPTEAVSKQSDHPRNKVQVEFNDFKELVPTREKLSSIPITLTVPPWQPAVKASVVEPESSSTLRNHNGKTSGVDGKGKSCPNHRASSMQTGQRSHKHEHKSKRGERLLGLDSVF